MRSILLNLAGLAVAFTIGGIGVAQAVPIPYVNDFDSSSLTNATAQFSLETGILRYAQPAGAGVVVATASEPITGIGDSGFVVSTRFILNQTEGTALAATMGFGALSSAAGFLGAPESYYLADWNVTATSTSAGQLRILAQGDNSNFTGISGDSDAGGDNGSSLEVGNTYELRLTGTYTGGTLAMTLALLDGAGGQIGTAATATDASPLAGQYFGYRNRTAHASHAVDFSYDSFSVVPEPVSLVLVLLGGLMMRRRGGR